MNRQELFQEIAEQARQGRVTREEILSAYNVGAGISGSPARDAGTASPAAAAQASGGRSFGIAKVLSYVGAGIVVLGIGILVVQNWRSLSVFTRVLVTFGSGVAAYVSAVLLRRYERFRGTGNAFFFIAGLLLPTGLSIIFHEAGWELGRSSTQTLVSGILFAAFLASLLFIRARIFWFFTVVFGTWLFFAFTNLLFIPTPSQPVYYPITGGGTVVPTQLVNYRSGFSRERFYQYRAFLAGISYLLIGYYLARRRNPFSGFLYFFGTVGVLGAAFWMGGFDIFGSRGAATLAHERVWELLFPGLAFGFIFLSVYLKRTLFLTLGSIALMVYILKISGRYFAQSLGWPLALVVAGLVLIAVGYLGFYLNRRFIRRSA